MTLRSIAYKNLKGNFHKYVMYYLSNTLVVMVFFIFANFIFNPAVSEIQYMGTRGVLATKALVVCEFVIIVFSLFFTSYSNSSFLKSREKEFGLLSMFGMIKSQVRRYVIYENMIVSLISIATGLGFGILFSKLFFMAISAIIALNVEIPFIVSIKALIITIFSFLLLFQGVNYISSFRIKNNNIIELLKGARVPKPIPKFSIFKAILSILLIGLGYGMAVFSGMAIIVTMIPIVIVTVAGTYFLFTQFSILITEKLKQNNSLFYNGVNMITLSQIIYKLKDNAKVLFIVAVTGAVALTASGTVYSVQQGFASSLLNMNPHDISVLEMGLTSHNIIAPGKVEEIAEKHNQEIKFKNEIVLLEGKNNEEVKVTKDKHQMVNTMVNTKDFYVMSNSDFNILAEQQKRKVIDLEGKETLVYGYDFMGGKGKSVFIDKGTLSLNINNNIESYDVVKEVRKGIINSDYQNTNIIVVSDAEYSRLNKSIHENEKIVYYSYSFKDWKKSTDTVNDISKVADRTDLDKGYFTERVTVYNALMEQTTLMLFIGAFIAILFFIATGSIIYFKLFNEIQKDKQEFISLKKIGMTDEEMKKIINTQTLLVFFLPFIVAVIHALFAIKALSNLLMQSLYLYLFVIVAIYFVLQFAYYIFAKTMYARQVKHFN